jgi:hypothetical protein
MICLQVLISPINSILPEIFCWFFPYHIIVAALTVPLSAAFSTGPSLIGRTELSPWPSIVPSA